MRRIEWKKQNARNAKINKVPNESTVTYRSIITEAK